MTFIAENSKWDLVLLREVALRGDIRCMREDGSFIEDKEEIREYFGDIVKEAVNLEEKEIAYNLGLVSSSRNKVMGQ